MFLGRPCRFFFNLTQATGHDSGMEVLVRVADTSASVACLANASAADLVDLQSSPPYSDTFETDAAAPTEDGVELSQSLADAVKDVNSLPRNVAVLGGSNLDEGTQFMYLTPKIPCNATLQEFERWSVLQFGDLVGKMIPKLYNEVEQPAPLCRNYQRPGEQPSPVNTSKYWQSAMRSAGDDAILCRTRELLRASQSNGGMSWWYYFTATPIRSVNEDSRDLPYMGAFHGADVPFVWGDTFELSSDGERTLSTAMGCYWTNFAITGDPNRGPDDCTAKLSLPKWPRFGNQRFDALELSNTTIIERKGLKFDQCNAFTEHARFGSEPLSVPVFV